MNSTLLQAGADLHALHRLAPERYPFLLQSTAADTALGGFDVLLISQGDALVLESPGHLTGHGADDKLSFLDALDNWWQSERIERNTREWPFLGGWFLYLGYELAAEIEPSLNLVADPIMPTAFAVRCDAAIIREHKTNHCHFIAESGSQFAVNTVREDIAAATQLSELSSSQTQIVVSEEQASDFLEAVKTAKSYISAGDIYQSNLSRGWLATCDGVDANRLYQSLCHANPGPFAGLVYWNGVSVVSSSPERLLSIKDGIASTRPIAGTRPRSDDEATDKRLLDELINDPKERAEHVMLIDLERNDLGRICEAGTVQVDEMMIVESYAHVHHIVSNVQGKIRDDVTPRRSHRRSFSRWHNHRLPQGSMHGDYQ